LSTQHTHTHTMNYICCWPWANDAPSGYVIIGPPNDSLHTICRSVPSRSVILKNRPQKVQVWSTIQIPYSMH